MQKIGSKFIVPTRIPLVSVRIKPTLRKIIKNSYDVEKQLFLVDLILILCLTSMQNFMKKIQSLTHKTRNLCLQGKRDPVVAKAGHANQAYIGGGP